MEYKVSPGPTWWVLMRCVGIGLASTTGALWEGEAQPDSTQNAIVISINKNLFSLLFMLIFSIEAVRADILRDGFYNFEIYLRKTY